MKLDVMTLGAKKAGSVDLDDKVFGLEPRADILHRMVTYQLAKRQQGTHSAKERNEVTATGKRVGRQKGGGSARHGARSANIFRGGGKSHGPTPRSHATKLPKKVRALALRHALSSKVKSSELIILEDAKFEDAKTKALKANFGKLGCDNALFVDVEVDEGFARAARNLPNVDVLPLVGANVYDILRREKLVLTKAAAEGLEARLK